MRAVGVTLVRQQDALGYPFAQTLASFDPLSDRVIIGDIADKEHSGFVAGMWDFSGHGGDAEMRRILRRALECAVQWDRNATHVLFLEADEAMFPEHVAALAKEAPAVAWLPRLEFWRDLSTLRLDWGVTLPRWAAIDSLLPALDRGSGDGGSLPVRPDIPVAQFPQWPIFHYGRVGNPRIVATRRKAVARMYAPESDLDVPDEYDFVPRRFDCWERGKQQPRVPGMFARYVGHHPQGIAEWATWYAGAAP